MINQIIKDMKKRTKDMKKRILISGAVYDLSAQPLATIEQDVQQSLNTLTGGSGVTFQIQQPSDHEIDLIFQRSYDYTQNTNGEIASLDADIITGWGLPDFDLPEKWFRPPFGYTFYFPIVEFLRCYKKSARALKASRAKSIQLDIQPTYIKMKLLF